MALCDECGKEMTDHVSCSVKSISINGKQKSRVKYRQSNNCHDCGCPQFGVHHMGCDMERCPNCRGQLIMCDCVKDDWV